MKFNIKNIWVLVLTGLLGGLSYVLGKCGVTRACEYYADLNAYSITLLEPTFVYSITLAPLALTLLFVNDKAFKKWLRFALWWLPLSILFIVLAKENSNSWMPLYPEATKENLALVMGALFTILSIRLVLRTNRTPKKP